MLSAEKNSKNSNLKGQRCLFLPTLFQCFIILTVQKNLLIPKPLPLLQSIFVLGFELYEVNLR